MRRKGSISSGLTIVVVLLLVFTQTGLAGRLLDVASWGALGWGGGADTSPALTLATTPQPYARPGADET